MNGKKYKGIGYDKDNNKEDELKYGNGYVKEVKNDIIYEWKYVNGEINGNGKEYSYDGQLNFEGEYLYGVKIKGKEYLENEIIFEGEFINDKKWKGKGKEYNRINQLIFEGEYQYGLRLKGKEYIKGKLVYEGDYFYGDKWNGKGYDLNGNLIYELIKGKGTIYEYNDDGNLIYEGGYFNGKKNGKGKDYWTNGQLSFEGEYLNEERNGKGKEYDLDGKLIFEGEYLNGEKWNGKYYENDEIIVIKEYLNGKKIE